MASKKLSRNLDEGAGAHGQLHKEAVPKGHSFFLRLPLASRIVKRITSTVRSQTNETITLFDPEVSYLAVNQSAEAVSNV